MIFLVLFFTFAKIGLFAVGGGLATLPFLYELTYTTNWITVSDIANMIAVSEATPGPLGVNMSTYVGYLQSGAFGSVTASLGLVFPSIVIILIVAKFLEKFKKSEAVQSVFYGLRPASAALIAAAGVSLIKIAFFKSEAPHFFWQGMILAAVVFIMMQKVKKIHPIVYIAASAVIGIVFRFNF